MSSSSSQQRSFTSRSVLAIVLAGLVSLFFLSEQLCFAATSHGDALIAMNSDHLAPNSSNQTRHSTCTAHISAVKTSINFELLSSIEKSVKAQAKIPFQSLHAIYTQYLDSQDPPLIALAFQSFDLRGVTVPVFLKSTILLI